MNIYNTREIQDYTVNQLKQIDKALVACAFRIRDNARSEFDNGRYNNVLKYKEGILLGKLVANKITVHGFGYNDSAKELYKARFFILGTDYRRQTRYRGKPISKPYTKGFISSNDAIDRATAGGDAILNKYIENALNKDE